MADQAPTVVPWGEWLVLVDPGWHDPAPEAAPPPQLILGGWMFDEAGVPSPFEPNPSYVPTSPAVPTDPVDAVLRRIANGDTVEGDEILAALRDAVVEIGCDNRNEPLVGPGPDGMPCVMVVTAAVHKHRVRAQRWWRVLGTVLPGIVPARVDILLNPGSPAQLRLLTSALLSAE